MSFNERNHQDITILEFDGRLTFTAGAELSRRISSLADAKVTKVILNLERVSYIDSAGLGAIVGAFTHLRHGDGVLRFVNPSVRTQHVLQITGIATLVTTFPTEAAAIDSFDAKATELAAPTA